MGLATEYETRPRVRKRGARGEAYTQAKPYGPSPARDYAHWVACQKSGGFPRMPAREKRLPA